MEEFGIIKYITICVLWIFTIIFVVEMPFGNNKKDKYLTNNNHNKGKQ